LFPRLTTSSAHEQRRFIDLTGQWTVGVTNTYGAYFRLPAVMSKGGRSFWLPIYLKAGTVPVLPPGLPPVRPLLCPRLRRLFITEFGIARLLW